MTLTVGVKLYVNLDTHTHSVSRVCRDPVVAVCCCTTVCFLFASLGAAADELINVTINVPVNWNMTHCSDLGFCNPVNIYTCVHFQAPSYVFPDSMYVTQMSFSHSLSPSADGVSRFSWVRLSFRCLLSSDTVLYTQWVNSHHTQVCRHVILKSVDMSYSSL